MRRTALEEGKRWLRQAQEDLRWAEDLAQRGGYYIACFWSQQAGEKALKAFLYAQGEEIVIGHSVEQLCHRASQWEPGFAPRRARWAVLDSFYIPTRYPNSLPDSIPAHVYTEDAAREAVSLAVELVAFVGERLAHMEPGP